MPQDVVLDTAVQHPQPWFPGTEFIDGPWVEFHRCIDRHLVHEVLQFGRRQGGELRLHLVFLFKWTEDAQHRPQLADPAGDGSGVDVVNARHAVKTKEFINGTG